MSFAIAHGGKALHVFFLGAIVAMQRQWPGHDSLLVLFFYQLAYYVAWAVGVSVAIGLFHVRVQRLKAEREKADANAS
jgi:hypothetical protein